MQENEFEKQVRELMDAFKLSPSEEVWEKVEPQIIKQKHKRRWIVLVFLFAGLMVSGYFIYNEWGRGSGVVKEEVAKKQNEKILKENSVTPNKKRNENAANKNSVAVDKKRNEDTVANSFAVTKHRTTTSKKLREKNIMTSDKNPISKNEKGKTAPTLIEKIFEKQNSVVEDKLKLPIADNSKAKIAFDKKAEKNNLNNQEQAQKAKEKSQKKKKKKKRRVLIH